MNQKIVIIGAGPTGLGCAWRLRELGYTNFHVFEANDYVGGLSASFRDDQGFTWDVGGHVLFSHYPYFDKLFETLLDGKYISHIRASWIRMIDRYIPYPFQNNLRYLPPDVLLECLLGLHRVAAEKGAIPPGDNFREWILNIFGEGIAKHFMFPYNEKVWAQPLSEMARDWIAERVSVVDFERLLSNVILERDDVSWGPNSTFKFPEHGGTGAIYNAFLPHLEGHVSLKKRLIKVDTRKRVVHFEDGESVQYDILVNTSPLDEFTKMLTPEVPELQAASENLVYTSGVMLGLGFARPSPSDKNWVYFPEDKCPIYRLTWFSNYSPNNVPDGDYFSLMGEISYSDHRPLDMSSAINDFIQGLIKTGVIEEDWANDIVSTNVIDVPRSYPVPSLKRNEALGRIFPELQKMNIYTRGRFGLWIYEIGNMDHSVMQGVELADHILNDEDQQTIAPYTFLQGEEK